MRGLSRSVVGVSNEECGMTFWISFLLVFRLFFLHCAVVIDEHECALILRIRIALRALVSRTQVALESDQQSVRGERNCVLKDRILVG